MLLFCAELLHPPTHLQEVVSQLVLFFTRKPRRGEAGIGKVRSPSASSAFGDRVRSGHTDQPTAKPNTGRRHDCELESWWCQDMCSTSANEACGPNKRKCDAYVNSIPTIEIVTVRPGGSMDTFLEGCLKGWVSV